MSWSVTVPRLTDLGYPVNFSDGSTAPTFRLAPNFNGLSQYGDVGSITYTGDYTRQIDFIMPTLSGTFFRAWGKAGDFTSRFNVLDDGSANVRFSDNEIGGSNLPAGTFITGQRYTVIVKRIGSNGSVNVNGTVFNFAEVDTAQSTFNFIQRMNGTYGVGIVLGYSDSLGNIFKMDDGFANNPVMLNSGSGGNGQYINATEAMWVEVEA